MNTPSSELFILPTVKKLPSEGVEYEPLLENEITEINDTLTLLAYKKISM